MLSSVDGGMLKVGGKRGFIGIKNENLSHRTQAAAIATATATCSNFRSIVGINQEKVITLFVKTISEAVIQTV